jgi:hypothetical protein
MSLGYRPPALITASEAALRARGVPEVSPAGQRTGDQQGYGAPSRAVVLLEVLVVWSFVYPALRRLLELMVLCWRSADAKSSRSWSSATSWQSCAASTHALSSSPKTARCLLP